MCSRRSRGRLNKLRSYRHFLTFSHLQDKPAGCTAGLNYTVRYSLLIELSNIGGTRSAAKFLFGTVQKSILIPTYSGQPPCQPCIYEQGFRLRTASNLLPRWWLWIPILMQVIFWSLILLSMIFYFSLYLLFSSLFFSFPFFLSILFFNCFYHPPTQTTSWWFLLLA